MSFISRQSRSRLLETRSHFEDARPRIVDHIARSLADGFENSPEIERGRLASELVERLHRHSHDLIHSAEPEGLWRLDLAHRARSVSGRQYLAFADALEQAVESCLGEAGAGSGQAWCEAYWAMIRAMRLHPHLLHP